MNPNHSETLMSEPAYCEPARPLMTDQRSQLLTVDRQASERIVRYVVRGPLDRRHAHLLNRAIAPTDSPTPVLVDACDVGFIDSVGLAALLRLRRRLAYEGRSLSVVCPQSSPVGQLIARTHLGDDLCLVG
jgi:anti-anti-sigma factor